MFRKIINLLLAGFTTLLLLTSGLFFHLSGRQGAELKKLVTVETTFYVVDYDSKLACQLSRKQIVTLGDYEAWLKEPEKNGSLEVIGGRGLRQAAVGGEGVTAIFNATSSEMMRAANLPESETVSVRVSHFERDRFSVEYVIGNERAGSAMGSMKLKEGEILMMPLLEDWDAKAPKAEKTRMGFVAIGIKSGSVESNLLK